MGSITSFGKQALKILICFCLVYTPFFANAASIGGWNLSNPVAQGASVLYDAAKNAMINGKNVAKTSTALITPVASDVAKVLARGGAAYALSIAVEQLLGAVDWVLDPANNRIIYYENVDTCLDNKSCSLIWFDKYGSPDSACNSIVADLAKRFDGYAVTYLGYVNYKTYSDGSAEAYCKIRVGAGSTPGLTHIVGIPNPDYTGEREKKYLPLEAAASQVISNAESNTDKRAAAQVATTAAAADIVAESEKDAVKARPILQQLEANSKTATDETATGEAVPKDPTAPDAAKPTDISLEFPVFCGWAPQVCEAAQVAISFPITLTDWWETSKSKAESWASSISEAWAKVKEEYANKPKENTDTQLDIPAPQAPDVNTDIAFGGQCPATRSVPVSFAGISTSIDLSFQWLCEIALIAKPVVISVSAFSAALIVAGVRGEDD